MNEILQIFAIILAWTGFIVKFQLLFFFSSRPLIVNLKQKSYFFLIFAWILIIIDIVLDFNGILITPASVLVFIATIATIFGRYFVVYDKIYPELTSLEKLDRNFHKLVQDDPEVAVLKLFNKETNKNIVHIYPLALLRVGDIVYYSKTSTEANYSLTFCLLCNTTHAYELPTINGKTLEITSNNGTVLNGNKILASNSGKYIWQQFSGQGLGTNTKNIPLEEIPVKRYIWNHAIRLYPDAYIYYGPTGLITRMFFGMLTNLVKNKEMVSFSLAKTDPRLRRKELIYGISLNGVSKAYPMTVFDPVNPTIIEDKINDESITIVSHNNSVYAFSDNGLSLKGETIVKNDKKWSLNGKSLDGGYDLEEILVTEKAYWYLWSKFKPNTEIYSKTNKT